MIKEFKKLNLLEKEFFLLFFSICFQNITLIKFGAFGLKAYHVISLIFIPRILKGKKICFPSLALIGLIFYLFALSILRFPLYGINNLNLNYLFALYILIVVCTLAKEIPKDRMIFLMKFTAWIILIIVIIKDLFYFDTLYNVFVNHLGHPSIEYIFGGGVNLEATWLSLFGFFFFQDKKGYIYTLCTLLISLVYASRVGIIGSGLVLMFLVFQKLNISYSKKIKRMIFISILLIIGLVISFKIGIFDYIIQRFLNIGDEPGSLGRLAMWKYVREAFSFNPFGYGLGNSIVAIDIVSGLTYGDKNLHNLFFQMLLDGGIIGFVWFCLIIFSFTFKEFKNFFRDPIIAILFGYIVLSLFQFRGGEATTYFIIGVYLNERNKKKKLQQND